jgi:hypothetical protein
MTPRLLGCSPRFALREISRLLRQARNWLNFLEFLSRPPRQWQS